METAVNVDVAVVKVHTLLFQGVGPGSRVSLS